MDWIRLIAHHSIGQLTLSPSVLVILVSTGDGSPTFFLKLVIAHQEDVISHENNVRLRFQETRAEVNLKGLIEVKPLRLKSIYPAFLLDRIYSIVNNS